MHSLSREWLDYQADRIEATLASHKIEALVTGVQISPRWVRFTVQPALGTRISTVQNLSEELALALEASAVRVTRSGGALALEIPLNDPQPVRLLALLRDVPSLPSVTAVLGLSLEGSPYLLPLTAPEITHVLVSGQTGCGKTELLRSLILSLALYNRQAHLQFVLIDPKRRGFEPLAGLPHLLAPVATEVRDAQELLEYVVAEMERRDRENAPATPHIILAIDEVSDLLVTGKDSIEQALVRLAQRGRESGFHVLCSTQKPSADAVPSALKSNLPARLIGRVASAQDALIAAGVPGTNAESLVGSGDFVAVIGGQVQRFQAAYSSLPEIQRIMDRLAADAQGGYDSYTPPPAPDYPVYYEHEEDDTEAAWDDV